jgi:hypothetical protein
MIKSTTLTDKLQEERIREIKPILEKRMKKKLIKKNRLLKLITISTLNPN